MIEMSGVKRQYLDLEEEICAAIARVSSSGRYIGGKEVLLFEEALAAYLGLPTGGVVGCANGSDALRLAMQAIGLTAGDKILLPTSNYVAALEAACSLGLEPIWVDSALEDPSQRYNIEFRPERLEKYLQPGMKAMVVVNLYGVPAAYHELRSFAQRHQIIIIEDNAQGMGGLYQWPDGRRSPLGSLGDIAITSFFPTKPLGGMGDGGAVMTNRLDWAERVRSLSNHGQKERYRYQYIGCNSRLDALQAAVLRIKLPHLDRRIEQTAAIAQRYNEAFAVLPLEVLPLTEGQRYSYHQYPLLLEPSHSRDSLRQQLQMAGISSQLYYPELLHQIALYQSYSPLQEPSCPLAEERHRGTLFLPLYPELEEVEVEHIIQTLIKSLS